MMYLGDFAAGGKVSFLWNTHAIAGQSITRSTDGTLKIFKSHATAATWATERSSLAGVTQLEDFDATGMHSVYIDLSDNTDAGFYAAGAEYQVAIVGAVVDGKTVNVPLACFAIERAGGVAAIMARLGAPVGASTSADIAAVKAVLPGALVSGRMDAHMGSVADAVLTAAKFAAGAFDAVWSVAARLLTAGTNIALAKGVGVTGFNDIAASAVRTELAVELARIDAAVSSRLSAAGYTVPPTAAVISDAVWDEPTAGHVAAGTTGKALTDAGSAGDPWGTALPGAYGAGTAGKIIGDSAGGGGGGPSAAQIADAVWDEPTAGHVAAGTFGEQLKSDVDAILLDTNELQMDWANGGRLDEILDAHVEVGSGSWGGGGISGEEALVDVDIAIEALDYIGKGTIRAFTDKSAEAAVTRRAIGRAIATTLEDYDWAWARVFRSGTRVTADLPAGTVYQYAYAYPPDAIKIRRVQKTLSSEAKPVPFEVGVTLSGARVIYTSRSAAVLVYTRRDPNLALSPPSFRTAAAWNLAGRVVSTLRKGEPGWRTVTDNGYRASLSNAATLDANESAPDNSEATPDHLAARGYTA